MALGDEIVLLEVRGTRRSRLSGASVEFRTATLVNILDGRIVRTAEISEQSQLEFWRSIRGRG
jgi:ketosteroid isomerase-like protein